MSAEIPYKTDRSPKIVYLEFNNAKFKAVTWEVPDEVEYKGRIVYVHGFAEESLLYTEFGDKLSRNGYAFFFFDQRGAGETSPGKLAGVTNERHTFADLDFMIEQNLKERKTTDEKFTLMGHLMGGGICLNYGIHGKNRQYIKNIVTCGPLILLHPASKVNPIARLLGPYLAKIIPNFKIDTKLNFDYTTSHEGWKEYLIKLLHGKLIGTLRQLTDMLLRGESLLDNKHASNFDPNISLLIVHGEEDKINLPIASKKFIDLLDDKIDKSIYPIKGGRHSLFIEREELFNQVLGIVLEFLNSH